MFAIYRKEIKLFFGGMFGYFTVATLLLFTGLFIAVFHLMQGYASFSYTLNAMQAVLLIVVPLLTMRSIAEERHSRTDQLLYSLPISLRDVVLGKYLAMLSLFAIPTAISALYPLILSAFGSVSLPTAYVSLFGYFLLGASMIALCMFVSSLVENQILAAVLSVLASLVLNFIDSAAVLVPSGALPSFLICILAAFGAAALLWHSTKNLNLGLAAALILVIPTAVIYLVKSEWFVSLVPDFLRAIDPFSRYAGFSYGRFDLTGTVFYLCFVIFFVYLTVRSMEKRRLS